jgi:hypothetical protein
MITGCVVDECVGRHAGTGGPVPAGGVSESDGPGSMRCSIWRTPGCGANGPVRSLVGLTPKHRRGHGALCDAVNAEVRDVR